MLKWSIQYLGAGGVTRSGVALYHRPGKRETGALTRRPEGPRRASPDAQPGPQRSVSAPHVLFEPPERRDRATAHTHTERESICVRPLPINRRCPRRLPASPARSDRHPKPAATTSFNIRSTPPSSLQQGTLASPPRARPATESRPVSIIVAIRARAASQRPRRARHTTSERGKPEGCQARGEGVCGTRRLGFFGPIRPPRGKPRQ